MPLNDMAQRVKPDWLYRWLRNPKAYLARTRMPNFKFSEQEAADIAGFILQGPKAKGIARKGRQTGQNAFLVSARQLPFD